MLSVPTSPCHSGAQAGPLRRPDARREVERFLSAQRPLHVVDAPQHLPRVTAAHDAAMVQNLTDLRNSTSGVSIDDEMINLTKAQAAYQAVSKVITTANDMLTTLMAMGIVTQ